MADAHVPYTGVENLDVMANAHHYNEHQVEMLLRRFGPQDRLLDFGAGHGTFARLMRARGFRVECLEIDSAYRQRLVTEGFTVHATLEGIADASLDGVYLLNVLEHVEHDTETLRLIRAKLRPGGRVFIYVPAFQVLYSAMDKAIGHWRRYSRPLLEATLSAAGFTVQGSRYHDSLGFLAALAYKFVGDREGRIRPGQVEFYDRAVFPLSRTLDGLVGAWIGKNVSSTGLREG
jgi:SAM-dependent methyltransferase